MANKHNPTRKIAKPGSKRARRADFWKSITDLEALAAQQGVKPVEDPDELFGDFWPEDEDLDDFLKELRIWRKRGRRHR